MKTTTNIYKFHTLHKQRITCFTKTFEIIKNPRTIQGKHITNRTPQKFHNIHTASAKHTHKIKQDP